MVEALQEVEARQEADRAEGEAIRLSSKLDVEYVRMFHSRMKRASACMRRRHRRT